MFRNLAPAFAVLACVALLGESPRAPAPATRGLEAPALVHRGTFHAADGKLATDLVLAAGATYSATLEFPDAARLGLRKTWACWVFPEDTWAIGGSSELELLVDDAFVTHFAVAQGEWKVLIQSLAEHITDRVPDPTRTYRLTLRNAGTREVRIRELWIRWLALR